jgi:hypothetical protein
MLAFNDTFSRLKKFLYAIVETLPSRSTNKQKGKNKARIQNLRSYSDASDGDYQG